MTNNDVLRRLRYTFNFNDQKMIALFNLAKLTVSREQISYWLKKEDDPQVVNCTDVQLSTFLNGLIVDKRGERDGDAPQLEKRINNNGKVFVKRSSFPEANHKHCPANKLSGKPWKK